ncbi:Fic family protein [Lujinxingia litoralis]|nr:Fic family protein [Lujinxingia litoralis]
MTFWTPIKLHALPDGRVRVFEQHAHTRKLRVAPLSTVPQDVVQSLPCYRENPKYITHYHPQADGDVERYAQVGDIVFCGEWRFGEMVQERELSGLTQALVMLRRGGSAWFPLSQLRVLDSNLQRQALTSEDKHLIATNRLHLHSVAEVNQALLLAQPSARAYLDNLESPLLFAHIREAHRLWFGRVFDWGGQLRTEHVVVGREENATTPPEKLNEELDAFDTFLHGLHHHLNGDSNSPELAPIWLRMADFYVRLCLIHPFRDGNGRISRQAIEALLSQTLGQPTLLNWNALSRAGAKTRWAFRAAQDRGDRRILATLLFTAWRTSLEGKHARSPSLPPCPDGLRQDICP